MTTAFASRPRLWARADYERLVSAGVFAPSEPEPDVAVVPGSARHYVEEHPRTATLVVEVHRDPAATGYRSVSRLGAGQTIAPLAAPGAQVAAADLLP